MHEHSLTALAALDAFPTGQTNEFPWLINRNIYRFAPKFPKILGIKAKPPFKLRLLQRLVRRQIMPKITKKLCFVLTLVARIYEKDREAQTLSAAA
jgi:hypothetical protein